MALLASREQRTQGRRFEGYLGVDLRPEIEARIAADSFPAFLAGEPLYAYMRISRP